MSALSDEEMLVVRSLRQAFENYGGAGSSINPHQNPFFVQALGEFDLLKSAKLVLHNLNEHRALKYAAAKADTDKLAAATAKALEAARAEAAALTGGDGDTTMPTG